jgi:hypothetical protein
MTKYILDCDMQHEPMHFEVEAENDDEAVTKMLSQLKPHVEQFHPDMAGKSNEDLMGFIKTKWHKAD